MNTDEIKIDNNIQSVIRPLSPAEFKQLEENILRDGVREPLSVWRNEGRDVLIDGHNRYKICTKHKLTYKTTAIKTITLDGVAQPLDSVARARIWVADNQKGRRNLDTNDWASLVAAVVPDFADEAKRKQATVREETVAAQGKDESGKFKPVLHKKLCNTAPEEPTRQTNEAVAKAIARIAPENTNRTYVRAVMKDAGYDAKKNSFKRPEKVTQVGSAPGQTKAADLVKRQRNEATATRLSEITSDNATKLPAEKEYSVLYVDCPWRYDFAETDNRKIENQYPTMSVAELCEFKVEFNGGKKCKVIDVAAKDAALFFWATAPKLAEALEVIRAWGFDYKTHAIWDKEKIGMGYWFRGQHEILMVATKGKMPPPDDKARVSSVIRAPRGKHSAKPDEVYTIIEKMYPEAARAEIFARTKREGWDAVGNQII
jgi:N6-adenosine-specific RNA methylase IME4